jgi:hypothetical protein
MKSTLILKRKRKGCFKRRRTKLFLRKRSLKFMAQETWAILCLKVRENLRKELKKKS